MSPSGMWRCVDLVLTDVSEEHIASIFRAKHTVDLGQRIQFHITSILATKTPIYGSHH
jgi:hypothetical protein